MSQQIDPLSPLAEAATAMHEMFESLVEAGFTEWQALVVVAVMGSKG